MSLYDLIKVFEAGISLFYKSSAGSIKRALDGLLAEHSIKVCREEPGPRGRKEYAITDAGRRKFLAWMTSPVDGETEAVSLARLYLLGCVAENEREHVLEHIVERLRADLVRLEELQAQITAMEVPDELHNIGIYQKATLDFGISTTQHALDWFSAYRDGMRKQSRGSLSSE